MSRCEIPGICGMPFCGDIDFCGPCRTRRLASQHENTSPAPSESPNTVGAVAQAGESELGNTLTVTLGDLGFIWALGVLFGVVGCLGVVL